MAQVQAELASLREDAAGREATLDALQRRAMVQSNRQELMTAGATAVVCELLAKGVGAQEERGGEALEPRIASKAMDLLAVMCCDDVSRQEAVEAGAINVIVTIARHADTVLAQTGEAAGTDKDSWAELRVCSVKTLLNFTQGATKALRPILEAIPVFISAAAFYETAAGGRDAHGQLRLYALMGLTNIANGGDQQQDAIIDNGPGSAISTALTAGKGGAAPALKLLNVLCGSQRREKLVESRLAAALASSLASLSLSLSPSSSSSSNRDALRNTCRVVAILAGGAGRETLLAQGVPRELAKIISGGGPKQDGGGAKRSSGEGGAILEGGGGEKDKGEEGVRFWAVKALERLSKSSDPQSTGELLKQDFVEAMVEAVRRGRLEEQEYALRALVAVAGGGPGEGVSRFVGAGGLEALRGILERCCVADGLDEEGLDDVAIKALHLVSLACRVDIEGQRRTEALLGTLARIAQSRDGSLQDLAVKGLLNLGRGGEEAKAKLASPDVVLSLTSLVRVEAGAVQLNAIKTIYHLARSADCHATLLEHGAASPLLEVCEVAAGDALQYALRALQALCAGKAPIRTHLLRCDALPVLVRCGRGEALPDRSAAMDCLASLAKDNTVAPLMIKAGVVDLAVETLRKGDVHEQHSCLLLLQRLSTASRILHTLVSAGVVAAVTHVMQAEADTTGGGIRDEMLLLAGLCVAPLLDSGSAVPDVPPRLWRLVRDALADSAKGVPLHSEKPPSEEAPATPQPPEESPQRRRVKLSLFEMLLAMRHFAGHKICRPPLVDAGVAPLLGSIVVSQTRDPSLPALAAQALYELATDRQIQAKVGKQLQESLGEEYLGRLALAANRRRPSSPDELDMLLVM